MFPAELERQYVDALRREIAEHEWAWTPETLYFGGGTPSLMVALPEIPREGLTEATLEAAPGTVSPERVADWRRAGINRVSLGVQTFVEGEIRRTGRKHTAAMVAEEVARLRAQGIENINIDLIAGLAGQTAASWRESLDAVERLSPPHVSVYILEVDEDSRLGQELMLGGVRYGALDVPSEERIVEFYETAVERLAAMGIARYEISNFARPGYESRHNLKYWRREPYVGFGADAHSFDGAFRWQNPESAAEYVSGGARVVEKEPVDAGAERFFVGLRLMEGMEPSAEEWARFAPAIERGVAAGVLERVGARLRLTARGVLVSNEVFEEFI